MLCCSTYPDNPFFKRGNASNGGVFVASNNNGNANSNNGARAVVVCGAGLLCGYSSGGEKFTDFSVWAHT